MKRGGVSTLNPYAAAYIPLSKRDVDDLAEKKAYEMSLKHKEEDEEFEMSLEYLQMAFPGVSNESIKEVYIANKADLDATFDMLTQLEFDGLESSENLPETLDIWDVSEPGSSTAECSPVKLKNVAGEAASSESTASGKVVIS